MSGSVGQLIVADSDADRAGRQGRDISVKRSADGNKITTMTTNDERGDGVFRRGVLIVGVNNPDMGMGPEAGGSPIELY